MALLRLGGCWAAMMAAAAGVDNGGTPSPAPMDTTAEANTLTQYGYYCAPQPAHTAPTDTAPHPGGGPLLAAAPPGSIVLR